MQLLGIDAKDGKIDGQIPRLAVGRRPNMFLSLYLSLSFSLSLFLLNLQAPSRVRSGKTKKTETKTSHVFFFGCNESLPTSLVKIEKSWVHCTTY